MWVVDFCVQIRGFGMFIELQVKDVVVVFFQSDKVIECGLKVIVVQWQDYFVDFVCIIVQQIDGDEFVLMVDVCRVVV